MLLNEQNFSFPLKVSKATQQGIDLLLETSQANSFITVNRTKESR